MIKRIVFLGAAVLLTLSLAGCSKVKELEFDVVYYEAVGLSESMDIDSDAVLLLKNDDYIAFTDKYFSNSRLPMDALGDNDAVIVLFIPSETNTVSLYYVKSLALSDKTLNIAVRKTLSEALVPRTPGADSTYSWVLFITVEKKYLWEDMPIAVTVT